MKRPASPKFSPKAKLCLDGAVAQKRKSISRVKGRLLLIRIKAPRMHRL
jgi:hypothetical protein